MPLFGRHRIGPGALVACGSLLLHTGAAGAAPGEETRAWAPSFSFFASQAAVVEPLPEVETLPVAPAVGEVPGCSAAIAEDCITSPASAAPLEIMIAAEPVASDSSADMTPDPDAAATPVTTVSSDPSDPDADAAAKPATAMSSDPDAAPERKRDETELWVPGLSFYGAALIQDARGRGRTGQLQADQGTASQLCDDDPLCIRPSTSGSDLQVTPLVAASLEIMTPALQNLPGRPRAFAHADAAASFSSTRFLGRDGVVAEFDGNPGGLETVEEEFVIGQGNETTAFVKTLILNGGLGVAFTADVGERRVRIRPSVEYLREKVQAEGRVNRVVTQRPSPPDESGTCTSPPGGPALQGCRTIQLRGKGSQAFHGVGPGLELEMDAARAGPVLFSVFTAGAAYRMLGDLDFTFSDTNELGETAVWEYEKDQWSYRAGVGLRMRFAPED